MSSITATSIVVHTEAAAPVDPAEQRRPYGSVAPLGSGGVSLLTARVGAAVCMLGSQVELRYSATQQLFVQIAMPNF